jgi:cell fate regulator YaaT (PSP1 superfamily)
MPNYIVRYGAMRFFGVFSAPNNRVFQPQAKAIMRTQRGLELGLVLWEATEDKVNMLRNPEQGDIIRSLTGSDKREAELIHGQEREEYEKCRGIIQRMNLPMNLVMVEHLFGGERIIIYYLAEGRVDFRQLVKVLASEFQTRIEMRQIGVRDEAKLLADFGDCGKCVCCNSHLIQMPPVSMKMAKLQKATLDPTKISGRCGRLKCCLRFEFDTYKELLIELPSVGSRIETPDGRGRIIGHLLIEELMIVEMEDRTRKMLSLDEMTVTAPPERRRPPKRRPEDSMDRESVSSNSPSDQNGSKINPNTDSNNDRTPPPTKPSRDQETPADNDKKNGPKSNE